ncbi:hypothetical protein PROFUN_03732 [Planoprotostelium fungivorum]|uniref:Arrestin-like N-terminal domain-containing protein n=1 Tax=Planoprotostelium fungivorum TaxID=1890364 RepID=A0A2P6NDP4_9EUKA|nr:hypothetical protein PROFUN_03732 [Planoprotostelium fungivorum]
MTVYNTQAVDKNTDMGQQFLADNATSVPKTSIDLELSQPTDGKLEEKIEEVVERAQYETLQLDFEDAVKYDFNNYIAITLDRMGTFRLGDKITGRVILQFQRKTAVSGVTISLYNGIRHHHLVLTQMPSVPTPPRTLYSESIELLSQETYLPSGFICFPFEFDVKDDPELSSSFRLNASDVCSIHCFHELCVNVTYPHSQNIKHSKEEKIPTFHSVPVTLDLPSNVLPPVEREVHHQSRLNVKLQLAKDKMSYSSELPVCIDSVNHSTTTIDRCSLSFNAHIISRREKRRYCMSLYRMNIEEPTHYPTEKLYRVQLPECLWSTRTTPLMDIYYELRLKISRSG